MVLKATVQKQSSRVTIPEVHGRTWTFIPNQVIKYLLPHMRLNQISDHKHDINLPGKLSAKLLVQAANKNTNSMFSIFPF